MRLPAVLSGVLLVLLSLTVVASEQEALSRPALYGAAHEGRDGPSTLYCLNPDTGAAIEIG